MNIRTILLSVSLITVFNFAYAQDDNTNYGGRYRRAVTSNNTSEPTGFIAVNEGFSTVNGNWGFGVNSNYNGTYALNGSFQTITAGIPINGSNFGVAIMLGFYDNPFDVNSFVNNAIDAAPGPNNNYDSYSIVTSGDYQAVNFMAGVFYTYPIGHFSFDARAMGGYISVSLPEIEYQAALQPNIYVNPTYEDDWDISSSSARGFGYDLGIGMRYTFRRNLCVMLNADILEASLPFSTVETQTHVDNNGNVTYPPNTYITGTVPLSLFNISLGLGFLISGR